MAKINGGISFNTKEPIPDGAVATIQILDVSLADAPAKKIAEAIIQNPKTFPINFEIQYDSKLLSNPHGDYVINARIETNGKLNFITDTKFSVFDHNTKSALNSIDFNVIKVN